MLTFTGAFIPTCTEKGSAKADGTYDNKCAEENFDFANAFVGKIGGTNFENYGESLRQKLDLKNLKSFIYPNRKIGGKNVVNPTIGTLHCKCNSDDGGAAKFNRAAKLYEDAYKKYVEADEAAVAGGKLKPVMVIYDKGNKYYAEAEVFME